MEMVGAYSAEDWHMIREMRENGMSISGIARTMGISRATVRNIFQWRSLQSTVERGDGPSLPLTPDM